jgi:hypothetical protein
VRSTHKLGCRYVGMPPKLYDEFLDYLSRVGCLCPYPIIRLELALPAYSRGLRRLRLPSGSVWVAFHQQWTELADRLDGNAPVHILKLLRKGCFPVVIVFRGPYFTVFGVRTQVDTRNK